jgi:hypothetical protein
MFKRRKKLSMKAFNGWKLIVKKILRLIKIKLRKLKKFGTQLYNNSIHKEELQEVRRAMLGEGKKVHNRLEDRNHVLMRLIEKII